MQISLYWDGLCNRNLLLGSWHLSIIPALVLSMFSKTTHDARLLFLNRPDAKVHMLEHGPVGALAL